MTGEEFCKWLNSKKEIKACEIDFTLDPKNPLAIVLLNIQITADNEKMVIAYPKLTDSEDETMAKAVSVLLVLNRLMEQYGIDKSFCYFSAINAYDLRASVAILPKHRIDGISNSIEQIERFCQ